MPSENRINLVSRAMVGPMVGDASVQPSSLLRAEIIFGVASFAVIGILIATVIDRSWASADDGAYAYIAERILNGDVLHRDIQDIHTGYIHFINAAAMSLFGVDLFSMRIPLALMALAQTVLAFVLVKSRGPFAAFTAAIAAGTFSFVIFNNPTPNWYAVFLTYCAIFVAINAKFSLQSRDLALGLVVGLIFLLRQPTGVFVGAGALLSMFIAHDAFRKDERAVFGKALLWAIAGIFALYGLTKAQPIGWILFGVGPVAVLLVGADRISIGVSRSLGVLLRMTLGGILAAAPLLIYHASHGSIGTFIEDAFVAPLGLVEMPFFKQVSYGYFPISAMIEIGAGNYAVVFPLMFWVAVLIAPVTLAGIVLLRIRAGSIDPAAAALLIIPVFHAMVSMHYEIPIYLVYSTGLALVGLIVAAPVRWRRFAPISISALSIVAMFALAGKGLVSTYLDITRLSSPPQTLPAFPKASIRIDAASRAQVARPLAVIAACTDPDDPIFAAPLNADLYFLSSRHSAFRFFGSSFGLRSDEDLQQAKAIVASAQAPALVIHHYNDKYNTAALGALLDVVGRTYVALGRYEDYDYYVRPDRAERASCKADAGEGV